MNHYRILIQAPDCTGLIYKASKIFYNNNLNIISNHEFVDNENKMFYMRCVVAGQISETYLKDELTRIYPEQSVIKVRSNKKKNIILMATKEAHVLGDLLIRYYENKLDANIIAVISNHNNLAGLCDGFKIPYHYVSTDNLTREEHEANVLAILRQYSDIDYIVLAKYMRILSEEFISNYKNQILNIHHSFLPAFVGANPYKQAFERGVKIIGATAHFVNEDLDEGPIIEQDIINVDHAYSWFAMQQAGQDVEKIVLAKALKLILEDRVFVHKNKTVIFK